MLMVLAGFRFDAIAPILTGQAAAMVDPVPQAMVLTAIVIGVGIQALALSLIMRVYKAYGTLDMRVISHRLEQDISSDAGVSPASSEEQPAGGRPLPPPVAVMTTTMSKQGVDA